jgi:hypothetical protein
MLRRLFSLAIVLGGVLGACTSSWGSPTWMDFTGWDHNLVTTVGQTFVNIEPGVDVTVTGSPNAFYASNVDGDLKIRTGVNSASQQLMFVFSFPLNLVLEVESLDALESLTVNSGGPINYVHSLGAPPTIAGNITMSGNGVAFGPTGCARGLLELGTASSFSWTFSSARPNKYEALRVASVIPEPGSLSMLGLLAGVAGLRFRRR